MQLPAPAPDGVNTPPGVIVPPVAVQVTLLLNAPVPRTFALQVAVCAVVIDAGVAVTMIDVIVAGTELTVTEVEAVAVPPFPVAITMYCKTPVAIGVTVTVPLQVTVPDKLPEPTQEEALLVDIVRTSDWPRAIDGDENVTDTRGAAVAALPPLLPPQPSTHVSNTKGPASIQTALRLSMSRSGEIRRKDKIYYVSRSVAFEEGHSREKGRERNDRMGTDRLPTSWIHFMGQTLTPLASQVTPSAVRR